MRREGMQGRNRSPAEGMRPGTGRMSPERPSQGPGMYGSGSRSFRRGGGGYRRAPPKPHFSPYPPPPPPPLRRKTDVLMEAGRLAAEYLVTKGLLPPNSLPPPPPSRWPSNGIGQELKGRDRDNSIFDGRVSALDRLGGADRGSGRKRYIDEYDSGGSRNSLRGRRRRMDQYNNVGHGSSNDWHSREKEKNVQWMDRSRSFGDGNGNAYGDDEDDYAPGYRRGGFEDFGDGGSGKGSGPVVDGEPNYRNEVTGESELDSHDYEDDSVSKVSVSGSRKDSTPERDGNLQKDVNDESPSHKETKEVKSDKSSSEVGHGDEEMEEKFDNSTISKQQVDLLKSFTFPKVPTRRRSAVGSRGLKFAQASATADTGKDEAQTTMGSGVTGSPIVQEPELDAENMYKDCSSSDKVMDSACSLVCSLTEKPSVLPGSHSKELKSTNSEFSLETKAKSGSLPLLEKSFSVQHRMGSNDVNSDPVFDTVSKIYTKSYSFPERSSAAHNQVELGQDSGFAPNMHLATKMEIESLRNDVTSEGTSRTRDWSSPLMFHDYELSNQKKLVNAKLFLKMEPGPDMNVKEEKHLLSNSFKICDLNLIHAHDVTEIPDDPVVEHKPTTSLSIDTGDIPTVDFGLSVGHSNNDIGIYDRPSDDNKIIQVIDLEDDSPLEDGQSDLLKPKSEAMYSNLEIFLNQTENAVDLPDDIHDGYGLPMSDLLGTDMPSCPAVSGEMNGLQQGIGLLEEGLPGDDVSMYASFGEIPISFMEPWDPPPQEYSKYF